MKAIADVVKDIQSELDRKEADLLAREQKVAGDEVKVVEDSRLVSEKMLELKEKEERLKSYGDQVQLLDNIKAESEALLSLKIEHGKENSRLRKWENSLAEIEARQEKEWSKIAELSASLSKEKEEYREKIKAEFLEEISTKLK